MKLTLLTTIQSKKENYWANVIRDAESVLNMKASIFFFGDADIDCDGSPYWHIDPDGSSNTSLLWNGHPINSDVVPGFVLPPEIINLVPDFVLGCHGEVSYKDKISPAVVFDVGPHYKLGEISPALARNLAIPPSPTKGGIDEQEVLYRFWPGVPATVDGITYDLKPLRS